MKKFPFLFSLMGAPLAILSLSSYASAQTFTLNINNKAHQSAVKLLLSPSIGRCDTTHSACPKSDSKGFFVVPKGAQVSYTFSLNAGAHQFYLGTSGACKGSVATNKYGDYQTVLTPAATFSLTTAENNNQCVFAASNHGVSHGNGGGHGGGAPNGNPEVTKMQPFINDIKYAQAQHYITPHTLKTAIIDHGWVYYKWDATQQNPMVISNGFYQYPNGNNSNTVNVCGALQALKKQTGIATDFTYEYSGVKAGLSSYGPTNLAKVVRLTVDAVNQCNALAINNGMSRGPIVGISFDFEGEPSTGNDLRYWRELSAYAIAKGGYSISNFAFPDAFNFSAAVAMGPLGFAVPSLYDVGKARWVPGDGKLPAQGNVGNAMLNASTNNLAKVYAQDKNCDDRHGPRSYCNINTQDTEESVHERMFGSGSEGEKDPFTNLRFTIPQMWNGAGFHVLWGLPWSATAMNWSSLEMQVNPNPSNGHIAYGNHLSSELMLKCSAFYGDKTGRCDTDPQYKQYYSSMPLNQFVAQVAGVQNWYQGNDTPFSMKALYAKQCQNGALYGPGSTCIEIPGNPSRLGKLQDLSGLPKLASFTQQNHLISIMKNASTPWQLLEYHQLNMLILLDQYMHRIAEQNQMSHLVLGNALYALEAKPNKCVDSHGTYACFTSEPYYIGWKHYYKDGKTESNLYAKEKPLLWKVLPNLYYWQG